MNARGKVVDTTYLSIDQAEDRGFIHRDYIAHCLRWSHVVKRLYERKMYERAIILDVGCGRELPLAKLLYSSKLIPRHYFGVDAGPINDEDVEKIDKTGKFPNTLFERQQFQLLDEKEVDIAPLVCHCGDYVDGHHGEHSPVPMEMQPELPNVVTCFEVLEHVEPSMCVEMLRHMQKLSSPDARFFISTPCWNRTDCAANHVNEITYEALGAIFEREGFVVENVYGTFASIRDYENHLPTFTNIDDMPLRHVFNRLREYYDTNFLSCVFAPLFPAQSRNCLWELKKGVGSFVRKYALLTECQRPWSSSEKWEDFAKC